MEQSAMKAEVWHGPLCYEKSDIEADQVFPLSMEGGRRCTAGLWITHSAVPYSSSSRLMDLSQIRLPRKMFWPESFWH